MRADQVKRLDALERQTYPSEAEEAEGRLLREALDWFVGAYGSLVDWDLLQALEEASTRLAPRAYVMESARIIVDYIEAAGRKNPDAEAEFWRRLEPDKTKHFSAPRTGSLGHPNRCAHGGSFPIGNKPEEIHR